MFFRIGGGTAGRPREKDKKENSHQIGRRKRKIRDRMLIWQVESRWEKDIGGAQVMLREEEMSGGLAREKARVPVLKSKLKGDFRARLRRQKGILKRGKGSGKQVLFLVSKGKATSINAPMWTMPQK